MYRTFKQTDRKFCYETELLRRGAYINANADNPEVAPIYMTTAFNVEDLDELMGRYADKAFCYNRNRNPNRNALIELMSYTEHGESSICCSSGMAAISTAIISNLSAGDHVLSDRTLYGETIEIFTDILSRYGVEYTFADFTDMDEVRREIRDNTKLLYTETISNPMITVPDLDALSELAHSIGALFIVDNTFVTSVGIRPLEHGADIVVNSLTKFANGHSDAVCGAATGSKELIDRMYHTQLLLGSQSDPFSSWLVQRGMRTMQLRVEKQMYNAARLAEALEKSPFVYKVNHPSLKSHPQHELAMRQFGSGDRMCGMISIVLEDDLSKMNEFMHRLNLAHYAMTLGGFRTSLSHPVSSSHYDTPEEERLRMGITDGLLRISVGIENTEELIDDFIQALEVYR